MTRTTIGIGLARNAAMILTCVMMSSPAWTQEASGISGVARDTSGAVLPGVSVEASSPALIEKVRAVVTDSEGRYNLVDLRPGAYVVTFTLPGFSTVRREGITLTQGFTATVNADLQVGSLEETITVTGAAPLVDTQNVRQQTSLSRDLLETLPTGTRNVNTFVVVVPGMAMDSAGRSLDVAGGYSTQVGGSFQGRGGTKTLFDGMNVQNLSGNGNTGYILNNQLVDETVLKTSSIGAESGADGAEVNMIPKEGGNTFSGVFNGLYSNDSLQSANLDDALRARNLKDANRNLKIYDAGVSVGGPIKQDKVWFFGSVRRWGNAHQNAGIYWNATQGTLIWTPDLSRPGDREQWYRSNAARVTWQASKRNKLNFFGDFAHTCVCRSGGGQSSPPETVTGYEFRKSGPGFAPPHGIYQANWNMPVTTRVLFEGAVGYGVFDWPYVIEPGVSLDHISVTDQALGFTYNNRTTHLDPHQQRRKSERFSVAYVTGSHNFKVGFQAEEGIVNATTIGTGGNVSYRFNNGVPTQITQRSTPYVLQARMKADLGAYVQDQWTINRLTLNLGLRYDYFNGYVPAQSIPATPNGWIPAREYPRVNGAPAWHDLDPRMGAAYDLFGDGRTAVKVSLGRYVAKTGVNIATNVNPITTSVTAVNRSWNDANKNYIPDCNLGNFSQNGECGAISDRNFGSLNPVATRYSPGVLEGWGVRGYNWDFVTSVEHQVTKDIGVSVGYDHSWYGNFTTTDNLAVGPADYTTYNVTAPIDPRLPGGGGYRITGLADISPTKFGLVENLISRVDAGDQKLVNNFVNFGFNARLASGMRFSGGTSAGRTVDDHCFVVDSPQELLNCRVVTPFKALTDLKLNGSYPLPAGIVVSGVFINLPAPSYTADYAMPNSAIQPSLGRPLAGGARNATVPLIAPMTQFEKRITRLDLRLTKRQQITPKLRLQLNLDIYNALNANMVISSISTYGSARWLQPNSILDARLLQFSGNLTF